MLRKRLITCLTLNDGVLFRTKEFIPDYRYTLNFVDAWQVDEIVILDVTRQGSGERENFIKSVEKFASRCFVPIAVGGGVRTLNDCEALLRSGADKIVINTKALKDPDFITRVAERYGSQCVVLSIDAKRDEGGGYEVFHSCGTIPAGKSPSEWAKEGESRGAGEIFLTSMERDGSLEGYDNALNLSVSSAVSIPLIVCGGAGQWQHFVDAFREGGASAVATTCIYHFTESSLASAKTFLNDAGILVRMS